MTKKEFMYSRIEKHGRDLLALFPNAKITDPVKLCKALFRLENKAHHATTALCNTNTLTYIEHSRPWELVQTTEAEAEAFFDKIEAGIIRILGKEAAEKCLVNYDPRGYALKIKDQFAINIYKDWGGYGILAPDFREAK